MAVSILIDVINNGKIFFERSSIILKIIGIPERIFATLVTVNTKPEVEIS